MAFEYEFEVVPPEWIEELQSLNPETDDLEFERTFEHTDWVDGEDVVRAEGEEGFNTRFHKIEQDLDALGKSLDFIKRTRGELAALLQKIKGEFADMQGTRELSFPPAFLPLWAVETKPAWQFGTFLAVYAFNENNEAHGVLPLVLPDKAKLIKLTIGASVTWGDGTINFILYRVGKLITSDIARLAEEITVSHDSASPIEKSIYSTDGGNVVDNSSYFYFLYAVGKGGARSLSIQSSSITYTYID